MVLELRHAELDGPLDWSELQERFAPGSPQPKDKNEWLLPVITKVILPIVLSIARYFSRTAYSANGVLDPLHGQGLSFACHAPSF
jgi:hypothetical protein